MNNRIGKFWISINLIHEHHDEVVEMFYKLKIVIVRSEVMYHKDSIEYVGISPEFREVPLNEVLPEYNLVVTVNTENGKQTRDYSMMPSDVRMDEYKNE